MAARSDVFKATFKNNAPGMERMDLTDFGPKAVSTMHGRFHLRR